MAHMQTSQGKYLWENRERGDGYLRHTCRQVRESIYGKTNHTKERKHNTQGLNKLLSLTVSSIFLLNRTTVLGRPLRVCATMAPVSCALAFRFWVGGNGASAESSGDRSLLPSVRPGEGPLVVETILAWLLFSGKVIVWVPLLGALSTMEGVILKTRKPRMAGRSYLVFDQKEEPSPSRR